MVTLASKILCALTRDMQKDLHAKFAASRVRTWDLLGLVSLQTPQRDVITTTLRPRLSENVFIMTIYINSCRRSCPLRCGYPPTNPCRSPMQHVPSRGNMCRDPLGDGNRQERPPQAYPTHRPSLPKAGPSTPTSPPFLYISPHRSNSSHLLLRSRISCLLTWASR